jgi:CubicO group peptidase (beta-lactamase class C family)
MVECRAVVEEGAEVAGHDARRMVPWWSFTKTVLATAALVLVRDGTAALDTPLPGRVYTLRHLLQHRSGLANYGGLPSYHEAVERGEDPWPVRTLLERTEAERLRYPAGEGWDYSNIGYLAVRELIEAAADQSLDSALRRLVLNPLGIREARVAFRPADLEGVAMGEARAYHPGWVYHGLMVGSVSEAALLLDGLLRGNLLPTGLLREMLKVYPLGRPVAGRPWVVPGYGLGLMIGEVASGMGVAGHTGGGPGSTIAVYRSIGGKAARTAAVFATSEDQAGTEEEAFRLIGGSS